MTLSKEQLSELSNYGISAAIKAGKLISEYRNGTGSENIPSDKELNVSMKADKDSEASQVLTEVDLLCDKLISSTLEPTLETYDIALLSEENEDDGSRLTKDYFWCIDPIDGTLPFIENTPGFSVSIALVSKSGIPQIGIIYDPVNSTLYNSTLGLGAFRNGKPWKRIDSDIKENTKVPLNFIHDRSFITEEFFNECMDSIKTLTSELGFLGINTIEKHGGAMNAIMTAEKAPACYFKFPNKKENTGGSLWDFAATAAIFNELKLPATNIHGNALDLNRKDSTYMSHEGVLYASDEILAKKIREIYKDLS